MSLKKTLFPLLILLIIVTSCGNKLKEVTQSRAEIPIYQFATNWPNLPTDFELGNPTGLGINKDNNIVAFHRAGIPWQKTMRKIPIQKNTILIIDSKTGELLDSWGANYFIKPHGLAVDDQDNIWVTDVVLHQVFKFSPQGALLMTLGEADVPGKDGTHFDRPTDVAILPDGSFYVSDGYGNSRVAKFAADGTFLMEWGIKGNAAGQFNLPHCIDVDAKGNVYVADRANNRIQKFDGNGNFLGQWQNEMEGELYAIHYDDQRNLLLATDYQQVGKDIAGSNLFVLNSSLEVQKQWGRTGDYDGPVVRYHDICIDKKGNLYVGDILKNTIQKFQLKK
ncbi:MAG: peptidyl-alpha-hydroxyglycine alpha-amidating lyase family protein [Bacteroidota bacterium]